MDLDELSCADNNSSLEESPDTFVITDPQRLRSYLVHDPFDHIVATFIDPAEILINQNLKPIEPLTEEELKTKPTSTLVIDSARESNCFVIDSTMDLLSHPDHCFYPFVEKVGTVKTPGLNERDALKSWGEGTGETIEENVEVDEGCFKQDEITNGDNINASVIITESLTEKCN